MKQFWIGLVGAALGAIVTISATAAMFWWWLGQ